MVLDLYQIQCKFYKLAKQQKIWCQKVAGAKIHKCIVGTGLGSFTLERFFLLLTQKLFNIESFTFVHSSEMGENSARS